MNVHTFHRRFYGVRRDQWMKHQKWRNFFSLTKNNSSSTFSANRKNNLFFRYILAVLFAFFHRAGLTVRCASIDNEKKTFPSEIQIRKRQRMSVNDIKIPSSTLSELRGALVRVLSRENLSVSDKIAIRKSQSSSSLKIHYAWNASYGGKRQVLFLPSSVFI